MGIKADFLQAPENQQSLKEDRFYYSDLLLDLQNKYTSNYEALATKEKQDVKVIYDMNVLATSIRNFLLTAPGQKILNPFFGLDLRRYLFEPVDNFTAAIIQDEITVQIKLFEPRITVGAVAVTPFPEEQTYVVQLLLFPTDTFLTSIGAAITIDGTLNSDGYYLVNSNVLYNYQTSGSYK